MKLPGGGGGFEPVCGQQILALASAIVYQQLRTTKTKRLKHKQKAKRAVVGVRGQVASMLELYTRQIETRTSSEKQEERWDDSLLRRF